MRSRHSTIRRSGISLLEVIMAFAIFLMSFAAISQLVSTGHDQALDAKFQTLGTRLAQSKLAEVEAGVIPITSTTEGDFPEAPGWQFSVTPGEQYALNTYEVSVRVWNPNNPRIEVTLSQIIFDPNMTGNAAQAVPPETTTSGSGQ